MASTLPVSLLAIVIDYFPDLAELAFEAGDTVFATWLWSMRLAPDTISPLVAACASEHFELAEWLYGQEPSAKWASQDVTPILEGVCKRGTSKSFQWIQSHQFSEKQTRVGPLIEIAFFHGNEELGMWLWKNFYSWGCIVVGHIVVSAASGGVEKIILHCLKNYRYELVMKHLEQASIDACKNGHIRIMELLITKRAQPATELKETTEPLSHVRVSARVVYDLNLIKVACDEGQLEAAKWLWEWVYNPRMPEWEFMAEIIEIAFISACGKGYLAVVQWLASIRPSLERSSKKRRSKKSKTSRWKRPGLLKACEGGHKNVVVWLWESSPFLTMEDLRADSAAALRLACKNGHLEIVELLWGLGLTVADLGNSVGDVLYCGFASGNVDLVKWVHQTVFPVDITDKSLIWKACISDSLPLLRFLVSIGVTKANMRQACEVMDPPAYTRAFLGLPARQDF